MDEHEGLRYLYFDVAHALRTQAWIIEHSGGLGGVKNVEHLESVLGHIQNDWYYPEMADKLTHLVYSVNKNHPFNDGNKRSSIGLGAYFLELNGYRFTASEADAAQAVLELAAGTLDEAGYTNFLRANSQPAGS